MWECRMKHDQGCELALIEEQIVDLFLSAPTGVLSGDEARLLAKLKVHKVALLDFDASSWRLKSRAVWNTQGMPIQSSSRNLLVLNVMVILFGIYLIFKDIPFMGMLS